MEKVLEASNLEFTYWFLDCVHGASFSPIYKACADDVRNPKYYFDKFHGKSEGFLSKKISRREIEVGKLFKEVKAQCRNRLTVGSANYNCKIYHFWHDNVYQSKLHRSRTQIIKFNVSPNGLDYHFGPFDPPQKGVPLRLSKEAILTIEKKKIDEQNRIQKKENDRLAYWKKLSGEWIANGPIKDAKGIPIESSNPNCKGKVYLSVNLEYGTSLPLTGTATVTWVPEDQSGRLREDLMSANTWAKLEESSFGFGLRTGKAVPRCQWKNSPYGNGVDLTGLKGGNSLGKIYGGELKGDTLTFNKDVHWARGRSRIISIKKPN